MKSKLVLVTLFMAMFSGFAQEDGGAEGKFGATAEDSVTCVTNISLYTEFYKQKNYKDAKAPLVKAIMVCPQARKNHYIYGATVFTNLYAKEKDAVAKQGYFDSLMWIYDMRIEAFGEKGYVLGRKGSDYFKYKEDDPETAFKMLDESFKLRGKKSEAAVLIYYYKAMYMTYKADKITKEELIERYAGIAEVIEYNIVNQTKESYIESYKTALESIEQLFSNVAECQDLITLFTKKFAANPDDINMLKTGLKLMEAKECEDAEIYIELAKKLNALEPSPEASYSIGSWYAKKDNCGEAVKYFVEAGDKSEDPALKEKAYLKAADCYRRQSAFSNARTYANKVIAINPKNGNAYILIGDCYAASAKSCGDNDCTGKAAYWVAVDKYYKAKQMDESVAEVASSRIATYTKYFPKKTDCFFYNITDGQSYTVECWINETTTVRTQQ